MVYIFAFNFSPCIFIQKKKNQQISPIDLNPKKITNAKIKFKKN